MSVTFKQPNYTDSPLQRAVDRANATFDELQLSRTRTTVLSTDTVEDDGEYGTTIAVVEHDRVADGVTPVLPEGHRVPRNLVTEFKLRFNRYPVTSLIEEFGTDGVMFIPIDVEDVLDRVALAAAVQELTDYEFGARDFATPVAHPTLANRWIATLAGDHPYYVGSFVFAVEEIGGEG